jgi:predicted MFS family arabinose efflux permease
VPTLVRDRLTWITFAQLGVYGYFLYGFGPSVPLLRDELGVSNAVSGLHGTALAAGSLLSGGGYAPLAARWGRARTLRRGLLGLAAGVCVYCLGPVLPVTMAGALVCGFSGSLVVTGSTVVLGAHHGAAGPAAISEANAGAAGAGLVAPLLVGAGLSAGLGWRPGILLAAVAAGAVWWLSVRSARRPLGAGGTAPAGAGETGVEEGGTDAPGRLPARYWLAWTVLVLCIGVEFCLTFWAADGLREHAGASPATATAGVTAVVAGMCAGRLVGGRVALRVDPGLVLLGALALSAAGFAVFWVATAAPPALVGLVVCGLGVALHFPLGAARAVAASGGRPDRGAGRISFAAGLASGAAPFALGAFADRSGTHTAFLLVPVLLVAAAGCVLATLRGRQPDRALPAAAQV